MAVRFDTAKFQEAIRAGAMRGVVRASEGVRNEVLRLILQTPKSGRVYKHRDIEHKASAPGEAPASDTGRLVNSIRTEYDPSNLTGVIIASTAYAAYLEFGTQKMEPRPFMRPALENRREHIDRDIKDEVSKVLKGFTVE